MSDVKIPDVVVSAEQCARSLDLALHNSYAETGLEPPLQAILASAMLRQLAARIARVERDLAVERNQHRRTEARATQYKSERDIARRERDDSIRQSELSVTQARGWPVAAPLMREELSSGTGKHIHAGVGEASAGEPK